MGKITEQQVYLILNRQRNLKSRKEGIIKLVERREDEFAELVDAVGRWNFWIEQDIPNCKSPVQIKLIDAYEKLVTPTSPREALAQEVSDGYYSRDEIADKIRELGK